MTQFCDCCGQILPKKVRFGDEIETAYHRFKRDFGMYPNILYIGLASYNTLYQELSFLGSTPPIYGKADFMGMTVVVTEEIKSFRLGFLR